MKNSMPNTDMLTLLILYIITILSFIIFAYDIEYDRDFMTWLWLLTFINNFILLIIVLVSTIIKSNKLN
jgi:hypothetical protein